MSAVKESARVSGLFDEAVQTFNEAVKAGVKVQEEIGKWWSDALEQAGPIEDWQKKSKAVLGEAIPAAQKNAEEWLKLVEQNYKRSLGMLKKAWDADPGDAAAIRAKTQELWESSLELVKDNTQAIAQANLKMMEVWAGLLRVGAQAGNGKAK
jgi:hypothetical protein